MQETLELSEPHAIQELDALCQAGRLTSAVAVPLASGGLHALRKGSELLRRRSREATVVYDFQHPVDQAGNEREDST